MNLVSVVTPVLPDRADYLPEVYASLRDQAMPEGWGWEWLLQQDGPDGNVAAALPDDPRVRLAIRRKGGENITRMMALSRAQGDLVKALDADDLLTPGALARDITALTEHPDIAWATCRVLDLLPDGSTVGFEHDPPGGRLARGMVLRHWKEHDYRAPVHPVTLCVRRDVLLALGGWMALHGSGDTGLLLALDAHGDGWFTREVGLLYRKWPGQVTGDAAHTEPADRADRMRVIEDRARALARLSSRGFVQQS